MKKGAWKKRIVQSMTDAGTQGDFYEATVDTLADILERRDEAMKQWKADGCLFLITRKSDRGAENKAKNPLLGIIQECERDALSYWSSLGLTPSSLKKVFKEEEKEEKGRKLIDALKAMSA